MVSTQREKAGMALGHTRAGSPGNINRQGWFSGSLVQMYLSAMYAS